MPIIVSAVMGLALWIVLWAFDVKSFDAFLLTIAIVLGATTAWLLTPFVKRLLKP